MPNADVIDRFDIRTGGRLGEPLHFDAEPTAVNFDPSGRAWVGLRSGSLVPVDAPRA